MPIVTCVPDNFGSRYFSYAHADGVDNATMASSPSSTAGNWGVGVLGVVVAGCYRSSRAEGAAESRSQGVVATAAKKPGGRGRGRGHRMLLQQPRRLLQQHPHITLHVGVTGCCCSSRDVAAAAAANEAVDRGRGHRKLVQQPRRLLQQH